MFVKDRTAACPDTVVGGDFHDVFGVSAALVGSACAVAHHAVGEMEVCSAWIGEALYLGALLGCSVEWGRGELFVPGVDLDQGKIVERVDGYDR